MDYPTTVTVQTPEKIARWRPLVQWIMAIPHLIISGAMGYLSGALAVISWFAIMFMGRLPAGLANLQIMIIRYSERVSVYAGFLHDSYPPFEFPTTPNEPGGTPLSLTIHPALENRNRLTVGLRIFWMIPALLYAFVIFIVGALAWIGGFFAILFTGKWPQGLHDWVMKMVRVSVRFSVYTNLLTDEYPPFSTD